MAVKYAAFKAALAKSAKVALDSTIIIYHLEDLEPYSHLTELVFAAIADGLAAVVSTISVTELLVKPFAAGRVDRVNKVEDFIRSFPEITLVPPSYSVAKDAARLRVKYNLKVPDAVLLATALAEKVDAFLTNDAQFRKLRPEGIPIMILDDYL